MSIVTIVHGGQTGVDRGAHDGAVGNGWPIAGYMPNNGADEEGPIPTYVADCLQVCRHKGYAARTAANLGMAHALLVVVEDVQKPYATPGTKLTLDEARRLALPRLVVDPDQARNIVVIAKWLRELVLRTIRHPRDLNCSLFNLMVAGPRASKWATGRAETADILRRLKKPLELMPEYQ